MLHWLVDIRVGYSVHNRPEPQNIPLPGSFTRLTQLDIIDTVTPLSEASQVKALALGAEACWQGPLYAGSFRRPHAPSGHGHSPGAQLDGRHGAGKDFGEAQWRRILRSDSDG